MSNKLNLYLDSCVFLDVWYDGLISEGKLFASSKKLLEEVINCKYSISISKLTLIELTKKMDTTEDIILDYFLKPFRLIEKLEIIKVTKRIAEEAIHFGSYYGVHKVDALHGMLSKMNDCILVTRDKELYNAAKNFSVEVKKPEELIL